jgi:SAM-dependent methyltransferase
MLSRLLASRSRGVTRDDVVSAYELLLHRKPESEVVINAHVASHPNIWSLLRGVIDSEEFGQRESAPGIGRALEQHFGSPPQQVEVDADEALLGQMLERVRQEWSRLGELDPHYSVLSQPEFRAKNMNDAALQGFRRSGAGELGYLQRFEALTGFDAGNEVCVEYGCGVGRTTRFLAERFRKVIAVDISPGNLELCREYMDGEGVGNVELVQLRDVSDIDGIPNFSVLFSRIVFQHNPPPIQKLILSRLLKKVGRCAFFQAATDFPGYSFDAETYLQSERPEIEMHCLPRHAVLKLIHEAGMHVLDVAPDPAIGPTLGSFTFFAAR